MHNFRAAVEMNCTLVRQWHDAKPAFDTVEGRKLLSRNA